MFFVQSQGTLPGSLVHFMCFVHSVCLHKQRLRAQFYLGKAISQNTKKLRSGMRQFYSFCSQTGIAPSFPISEDILINFSVCMARSVQYCTIKKYLSAIKYYHSSHGYALNLSACLRLQLILRGIKRSQGVNSKVRRPITLPILNLFYHLLIVKYTMNKEVYALGH